ncbi:MAG: hypothetical protein ABIF18_02760 [archaeon]
MISSEEFFLKYAFPCAHVLFQVGAMTEERYKELENSVKTGDFPSRQIIELSFPSAFRRIKKLAKEVGVEDYWDMKVMKEYWHKNHNVNIDEKEGSYAKFPECFCDFCKVHVAKIIEIFPNGFFLIEYNGKKRPVSGEYISDAKIGDEVRIHHAYAVEKIYD